MNSHARLTYTQVWKAVGEEDAQAQAQMGALLPQVQQLHRLYQVLAKARAQRGAIEFESSEVRFVLDNRGEVTQAGMLMRNDAHKLIEECMIVANVQAAHFCSMWGYRHRIASMSGHRRVNTPICWSFSKNLSSVCRRGGRCSPVTLLSC